MIDPASQDLLRRSSFRIGYSRRTAGNDTSAQQLNELCTAGTMTNQSSDDLSRFIAEYSAMPTTGLQAMYTNYLPTTSAAAACNDVASMTTIDQPLAGYFTATAPLDPAVNNFWPAGDDLNMTVLSMSTGPTVPAIIAPVSTVNDVRNYSAWGVEQLHGSPFMDLSDVDNISTTTDAFDGPLFDTAEEPPRLVADRRSLQLEPTQPMLSPFAGSRQPRQRSSMPVRSSPSYTCYECPRPRVFERKCELRKHSRYHARENRCDVSGCDNVKGFGTPRDLERHKQTKHGIEKEEHFCVVVGCKYNTQPMSRRDNARRHMLKKHGISYNGEE